ncbi:YHYH domain-containing protein [Cupriavidus respiraculi]|uniref:YHYH domain-containing protein n=3 Tax=Cupriavidus respiraculi TaxID=195930 RepID=A0ABN7YDE1_9BURK|nr:hypothetical protein LMG21510_01677 [Cupriavidus respiraculi]
MRTRIGAGALALLMVSPAFGHGGGLNAEGCHTNRKTGDYHCHRGGGGGGGSPARAANLVGTTLEPKATTRQAARPAAGGPTCYTGPRGGTYTITASGRKNYGGC